MRETHTVQTSIFDFYANSERGAHLQSISRILDQHPELIELIKKDLIIDNVRDTGRKGLSVESVFRCIILKQTEQISYKDLSNNLAEPGSYRAFARLDRDCYPSKAALSTNIRKIKPETLEKVFETLSVSIFRSGQIDHKVLRMDATVVESNILEPLDSQLLNDGVRVISRLISKSREETGIRIRLKDHRPESRSLSASIFYAKKPQKDKLYEKLIPLAFKVVKQCDKAVSRVIHASGNTINYAWIKKMEHYQSLLKKVIDQAQRRVFGGESVPASEKIVSIFEPHTDIIVKGERKIQYGHKINLSTEKNGFITALNIEKGNPIDSDCYIPLLKKFKKTYKCTPDVTISDGCFASNNNVKNGKNIGVSKNVFHKKNGIKLSDMGVKQKTLKKLKDFRAGIEANISELKRVFGLRVATWKGESGFKSFVWASAISYNLSRWARLQHE